MLLRAGALPSVFVYLCSISLGWCIHTHQTFSDGKELSSALRFGAPFHDWMT